MSDSLPKPEVELVGTDGNIFALLGRCRRALRAAGNTAAVKEMTDRVTSAGDYDTALAILCEYVEAV
jgi:hypothetical protein